VIRLFFYEKSKVLLLFFLTPFLFATTVFASEVVVYTSVDQVFSEPILDLFEQRTGVQVKAVYDVEAAKTVGLTNRLLAEKKHPRADVFWNSEIARTIVLKKKGVLAPYLSPERTDIPWQFKDQEGFWTGFSCRARVLIYNTDMLQKKSVPSTLQELTDPAWHGKVAMAYPLLGTAATHMGALYAVMGQEKAESFLTDLNQNKVLIVAGNSVVRDVVAAGEVPIGITDTDDVNVAMLRNKPVAMIFPDQQTVGAFLIPNTVALVKGGPNPETGKQLIDFLLSQEVENILAESDSRNIPVRKGGKEVTGLPPVNGLKVMAVDYQEAAGYIEKSDKFCRSLFVE
jgi:iron(III) transport system substrate-binding protein